MGIRSSLTGWQAVAVCALLVVGAFGVVGVEMASTGGAGPSMDSGPAQQGTGTNDTTTETNNTTTGTNETAESNETTTATNVTVPVSEALTAAQNRTNGTAVAAELEREGNVTDLERPTMIYEVDVLLANGTHLVADVNATDGSVRNVEPAEDGTGLFDELFGSDDELPSEQADPSSIRSAVEAVELVRNGTDENATVTSVRLNEQDGQLRYTIEIASAEGIQSTVVVAANPDEGGVLTTEADGG